MNETNSAKLTLRQAINKVPAWPNAWKLAAYDVRSGVMIRAATNEEIAAYHDQKLSYPHPAFRARHRVGDVMIDEDAGPGMWFGGAGF